MFDHEGRGKPVGTVAFGVLAALALAGGVIAVWLTVASRRAPAPPSNGIHRERRRMSRIIPPHDKPAELQIMGQDFLEIPEVRDISATGLAISVPHKFNGKKPTQEVELLLTLHGQGTVRARGAIRNVSYTRHDTTTFGVELVGVSPEDRVRIERYLQEVSDAGAQEAPWVEQKKRN
jgi:hypothetical protein